MSYLVNFIAYTFAMVGVLMLALVVFKNTTNNGGRKNSKFLKIHDAMSLGARKTLYIVSAGEEKFLIASDVDKTTLISKLNTSNILIDKSNSLPLIEENIPAQKKHNIDEYISKFSSQKSQYMDKSIVGINSKQINQSGIDTTSYSSVMKNLAQKMNVDIGGNV